MNNVLLCWDSDGVCELGDKDISVMEFINVKTPGILTSCVL